jgi:hypothetical protein
VRALIAAPRAIAIYIYQNLGYENVWFAAHLLVLILVYFGGSRQGKRRFAGRGK